MAAEIPEIRKLQLETVQLHRKTYGCAPTIAVAAPGRVNLIGEHTDYNDGFVLPMALPLVTLVVGNSSSDGKCRITTNSLSVDNPAVVVFDVPTDSVPISPGTPKWANYLKGVIVNFPGKISSFQATVNSSVPLGGGLSSSASLEVAMYTFLEELSGKRTSDLRQKALACQKAEHDFAKVPCGIMDQFVAIFGKKDHAVLIDCRSMECILVPLVNPQIIILITNSNVRHELSGSEYPTRRRQCEEAASLVGKSSLREVTPKELEGQKELLEETIYRRARHVVTEIERTTAASDALAKGDYERVGKLMFESHYSLRDDYQVSCKELDQLVELAREMDGVFGSRMTGGGFGGCTVTLVKKSAVEALMNHVKANYTGEPTFYACNADEGARVLTLY